MVGRSLGPMGGTEEATTGEESLTDLLTLDVGRSVRGRQSDEKTSVVQHGYRIVMSNEFFSQRYLL